MTKQPPREIPTKHDPVVPYPDKAPNTAPSRENPRNPRDDEIKPF